MVHPGVGPGGMAAERRRLMLGLGALLTGCAHPRGEPDAPGATTPAARPAGLGTASSAASSTASSPAWAASHPGWLSAPELLPTLPEPAREFRAAWVATVANIDWPSRPGLSAAQQQQEMRTMLDRAAQLGLNAIILQVRTSCDALYESALEPWSEFLTGRQGVSPGWDPLAVWIREAHARGLELHAWFNPFRARHSTARSEPDALHVSRRHPQWVRRYGEFLWLDPAEPQAAEHTLAVVSDVLRRYAVDGIHIDDYFYPYPVRAPGAPSTAPEIDFPDHAAWARASAANPGLNRADWRRQQVDELVRRMHEQVRRIRPSARFGVSPFGIGKPALRPPGIAGFSQYDKLYADVERWLAEGWMDYLAPQLYWPRAQAPQAFGVLLDYWRAQNPRGRHVWAGLYTSRIHDKPESWMPEEIEGQIELVRTRAPGTGHLHFSMIALHQDRRAVASRLQRSLYAQPALAPATPWLAQGPVAAVDARLRQEGSMIRLDLGPGSGSGSGPGSDASSPGLHRHLLWLRRAGRWELQLRVPPQLALSAQGLEALAFSALDAAGNEGPRRALRRA